MDRTKRIESWNKIIIEFCTKNKIKFSFIEKYQIRIYSHEKIDIFPKGKRYHNITKNERGDIEFIKVFLELIKR